MNIRNLPFLPRKLDEGVLTGLAFGPGGVAVARVRREPEVPAVLDLCEFVESANGSPRSAVLASLCRNHRLDRTRSSHVLDQDAYSLLLVEAPSVPESEARAAVGWKIKELIDFSLEDAVIDTCEIPSQKPSGQKRMIYAVVAQVSRLRGRIDELRSSGFNLAVIDIPELAHRNLAACLPEDVSGVAMLYLNGEKGLITLTRKATLFVSRKLDFGLDSLGVGTVEQGFDEEAEPPAGTRDWLDGLLVQVQRSLDYYERSFSQPPIAHLAIAPLARNVPGIVRYFRSQLGLSARLLDLNHLLDCRQVIPPDVQARCFSAVGAALRRE